MGKGKDSNRYRACEAKHGYESKADAEKGLPSFGEAYQCRFCGKWHRTNGSVGKIARLAEFSHDPVVMRKMKRAEQFTRRQIRRHERED